MKAGAEKEDCVKISQNNSVFLEGVPWFVEIIVKAQNGPHQGKVLCTVPVHHALIVGFTSFLPTNHGRVSIFHLYFFFFFFFLKGIQTKKSKDDI